MTQEQITEGNFLIALFMGIPVNRKPGKLETFIELSDDVEYNVLDTTTIDEIRYIPHVLKYHSSWDWQIPAYAKFIETYRNYVQKNPQQKLMEALWQLTEMYRKAVENNNPPEGFELIVGHLTWYNTQSTQQSK